jgi:hypothetical protein
MMMMMIQFLFINVQIRIIIQFFIIYVPSQQLHYVQL